MAGLYRTAVGDRRIGQVATVHTAELEARILEATRRSKPLTAPDDAQARCSFGT